MRNLKKLILPIAFGALFLLGGCFEITQEAQSKYTNIIGYCPLKKDTQYQISVQKNGKLKKSGTIRAENIIGGTCALKDLADVDIETSNAVLEMIRVNFYYLKTDVAVSFKVKEGVLNRNFVISKINPNGQIYFYTECGAKNSKVKSVLDSANIQINGNICKVEKAEQLEKITNSLENFVPTIVLTPL